MLEYSDFVFKIPRISGPSTLTLAEIQSELTYDDLEHEKDVYRQINGCSGTVKCLEITDKGIKLERLRQGCLADYIERNKDQPLPLRTQLNLAVSAIESVRNLHRYILVFDIHGRNALLSDDLNSLLLCDFCDSIILTNEDDAESLIREGVSMQVDIFRLGSLIYSITAWTNDVPDVIFPGSADSEKSDEEGREVARWPPVMRSLREVPLSSIITKCWTYRQYQNSDEILTEALQEIRRTYGPA